MNAFPLAKSVSKLGEAVSGFVGLWPWINTYLVDDDNNKLIQSDKKAIDAQKSFIKDFSINNKESVMFGWITDKWNTKRTQYQINIIMYNK